MPLIEAGETSSGATILHPSRAERELVSREYLSCNRRHRLRAVLKRHRFARGLNDFTCDTRGVLLMLVKVHDGFLIERCFIFRRRRQTLPARGGEAAMVCSGGAVYHLRQAKSILCVPRRSRKISMPRRLMRLHA